MPQMALLTGSADNLGCFLSGIGIASSEFSAPHAGGRLDIYQGLGNGAPGVTGGTAGNCTTSSCPLWQSTTTLEAYDIVLLACEGGEHGETKPAASLTAMHDWLGEGGKVFATHYHYYWFEDGPADFKSVATWGNAGFLDPAIGAGNYNINTTFNGGMTFDSWLGNVGALNSDGTITLMNVAASINTVNAPTLQWIYGGGSIGDSGIIDPTKYMSFGTPIGGITVGDAAAESSKAVLRKGRRHGPARGRRQAHGRPSRLRARRVPSAPRRRRSSSCSSILRHVSATRPCPKSRRRRRNSAARAATSPSPVMACGEAPGPSRRERSAFGDEGSPGVVEACCPPLRGGRSWRLWSRSPRCDSA